MNRSSAIRATSLRGVALLSLLALACSSSSGGGGGVGETELTLDNAPLIAARVVAASLSSIDISECAARGVGSGGCGTGSVTAGDGGVASSRKSYGGSDGSRGDRSSGPAFATREDPNIIPVECANFADDMPEGTLTTSGDVANNDDFPNGGDLLTLIYDFCDDGFLLDGAVSLLCLEDLCGVGFAFDNRFDMDFDDLLLDGFQKFTTDPVSLTANSAETQLVARRRIEIPSLLTEPITVDGDSRLHLDTASEKGQFPAECELSLDNPVSLLEMSGSQLEVGREGTDGSTADTLRSYTVSLIEDDTIAADTDTEPCPTDPEEFLYLYELEFHGLLTSTEFEGQVTFETIQTFEGTDDSGIRPKTNPPTEPSGFLQLPETGMARITGADGATITLVAGVDEEDPNQIELDVELPGSEPTTLGMTWQELLEDVAP